MRIKVKLYASLRWKLFDESEWDCDENATVADVVDALEIPRHDVGTALVNGLHALWEDALAEGDVLSLLPRMGGG